MVDIDRNDQQPQQEQAADPQPASVGPDLNALVPPPEKSAAKPASAGTKKSAAPAAAATTPPPIPSGPLVTVVTRNEFYRDGFRNMIRIAILEAVIILALIAALATYIHNVQPTNRYFATTADGRIMQLVPLDQPSVNPNALMSWVSQAVTETMTFGFHDYQRRLQQSSRHFTRRGWETFTTALQKSRIIDGVTGNQQVVTAEPRSAPILVGQGVQNGKYRWVVRLPIRVTYKSGKENRAEMMTVQLVVERVSSLENPSGIGIDQWVATAQ